MGECFDEGGDDVVEVDYDSGFMELCWGIQFSGEDGCNSGMLEERGLRSGNCLLSRGLIVVI